MRRGIAPVTIALLVTTAACASAGGGAASESRPMAMIPFASTLDVDLARMTKTPGGVYYRDVEVGTGSVIRGREDVMVHYTGWLTNGVKFDSNTTDDQPLTVPLGRGRAIKGWDEGLAGMRVGGRRQLVIPPELGYGSNRTGAIPPDAVLVFDIRVVSAK
ncbi:MAG: FKBP-type peptidyl-prolyl cis-trans isomerase [Gemmatimonadales bacterium]